MSRVATGWIPSVTSTVSEEPCSDLFNVSALEPHGPIEPHQAAQAITDADDLTEDVVERYVAGTAPLSSQQEVDLEAKKWSQE